MALNNMGGLGVTININVNAPGAQQTTQGVAAGLNQVAAAGSRAAQAAGGARQQFANLAGEFTKMVVGKHMVGLFAEMAMKADEVTQGMANIKSYMIDGADPTALIHLKSTLMDVAETAGKSFLDMAQAAKELISHGLSVDAVENIISPLTKFQTVSGISADKATDLTMALVNMGIEAKDVGSALDVMMNLTAKTPIRAAEFTDVLIKAAPAATLAKQSFLEIASSTAILRKSFSSGKEEASALLQTILTLERSKIQDKVKKAFGVEVRTDNNGGLKPMLNIIQEINTAIKQGHGSMRDIADIFGVRSGARVLVGGIQTLQAGMNIGGQNRVGQDLIDATRQAAGQSGGAVDKAFSVKMESLLAQIERLKVAFGDLIATFGGQFANSLTAIVKGVTDLVEGLRHFLEMSPIIKGIVDILVSTGAKLALVVGGMLVLSGGVKIASLAFANLRTSLFGVAGAAGVAGTAAKGFWRSLLGPIGLALTVISLVSDIFGLFSEGEKAQDKSLGVADSLKQTAFANKDASDKLMNAADSLEEASRQYKELVVQYTKLLIKDFPSIDTGKAASAVQTVAGMVPTLGNKLPEGYRITPEDSKELQGQINKFLAGNTDTKTVNEAVRALQIFKGIAAMGEKLRVPGAAKASKEIQDMVQAVETSTTSPVTSFTKALADFNEGKNPTIEGAPRSHRGLTELHERNKKEIQQVTGRSDGLISLDQLKNDPKFRAQIIDMTERQAGVELSGGSRGGPQPISSHLLPGQRKVVIDMPVELKVDGASVNGTLRVQRRQEDVEGLKSQ